MILAKSSFPHDMSIVLFTRFPEPGLAKKRLAWDIGDRAAAEVHRYTMSTILELLVNEIENANIIINYSDTDNEDQMRNAFYPHVRIDDVVFIKQPSLSFGEKLDAIARHLDKVLILAADTPGISSSIINDALMRIRCDEAVIGPTRDGGYYMVGLPRYRDVFTGVDYSAGNVSLQTLDIMKRHYANVAIAKQTLIDIDTFSDLQELSLENAIEIGIDISVIIPTLNESENIYQTLQCIRDQAFAIGRVEIIVVDGGSRDNTLELICGFQSDNPDIKLLYYAQESPGRSFQMNFGFRHSSGKYVLFCHADTLLPEHWDLHVANALDDKRVMSCFFMLKFDESHRALRFMAWSANEARRVPYGDQCLCFRRDYFQAIGKFDFIVFLEDVLLMYDRKNLSTSKRIRQHVVTQARKYKNKEGVYSFCSIVKNSFKNMGLMFCARYLKIPACILRSAYSPRNSSFREIELTFYNKRYSFLYIFPEKLHHRLLVWKVLYFQRSIEELTEVILKYCSGDDMFIDVGANVGILSILLSIKLTQQRINTDIVAFEAVPELCALFKKNLSYYAGETRTSIILENIALSEKAGFCHFQSNGELSRIVDSPGVAGTIAIKSLPLDDYLFSEKKISIIKIDVEGAENRVLQGMRRIVKLHRPVIIYEILTPMIRRFLNYKESNTSHKNQIEAFFNEYGYQVERLDRINYIAIPR